MATTMYTSQPGAHYGYPQPPPSPPIDENSKCSLPSISNLLVMADAGSPTTEQFPASQQQGEASRPRQHMNSGFNRSIAQSTKSDTRPNSSHYTTNGPLRSALPPTPPMSTDASFEGYGSPSTKSVSQVSVVSGPSYYYESTPPLESDVHRQHMTAAAIPRVPIQAPSYPQQAYAASSYMSQPAMASYYPPMHPGPAHSQISSLYFQRPLPQVLSLLQHCFLSRF
jgi:hypothetical protein